MENRKRKNQDFENSKKPKIQKQELIQNTFEENKKRSKEENSNSIFSQIPLPLWSQIFQIVQESQETLSTLRLVCKSFRNLISPYWIQVISKKQEKDYSNYFQIYPNLTFKFIL